MVARVGSFVGRDFFVVWRAGGFLGSARRPYWTGLLGCSRWWLSRRAAARWARHFGGRVVRIPDAFGDVALGLDACDFLGLEC